MATCANGSAFDFAHLERLQKELREPAVSAAEDNLKTCAKCGSPGEKRCVKCRLFFYCGKTCQEDDWAGHKQRCKELRRGHLKLAIAAPPPLPGKNAAASSADPRQNSTRNGENRDGGKKAKRTSGKEISGNQPSSVDVDIDRLFDVYNAEWPKKGNLVVKVQAGVVAGFSPAGDYSYAADPDQVLRANNERRNFECCLCPKSHDARNCCDF